MKPDLIFSFKMAVRNFNQFRLFVDKNTKDCNNWASRISKRFPFLVHDFFSSSFVVARRGTKMLAIFIFFLLSLLLLVRFMLFIKCLKRSMISRKKSGKCMTFISFTALSLRYKIMVETKVSELYKEASVEIPGIFDLEEEGSNKGQNAWE